MNPLTFFPRPPFSLHWSATIFENHDPSIRIFKENTFLVAASLVSGPVLLTLSQDNQDRDSPLILTITSDMPIQSGLDLEASNYISRFFSLDEDLTGFYQEVSGDPILDGLAQRFYGLHSPTTPTIFEALVDSIIEQQISLSVARSLEYRFIRKYGQKFEVQGREYFCYPTPEQLALVPVEDFRSCGFTLRKGEYIRDISKNIVRGELSLDTLAGISDPEEIIEALCNIRGIGRWTAELTMLRGLHRMDAFPADDIALRRMISRWYYGERRISADEAKETAAQWGSWKGLASYYLEVAEHCGIIPEIPVDT